MLRRDDLEPLYRRVKDRLESGKLNDFRKAEVRTIDRFLDTPSAGKRPAPLFAEGSLQYDFLKLQSFLRGLRKAEGDLALAADPLRLKAVSMSLEFRDYLEGLPPAGRGLLDTLALEVLEEFRELLKASRGGGLEVSTYNQRELLKEKARLVSIYANQLRRRRQEYRKAAEAIKSAKEVAAVLRRSGTPCNTVLGGLCYVEGKLLQQVGRNRECERMFTDAVAYYSSWAADNSKNSNRVKLASYKIAMFLGGIAWCKNSRGFCTDALALVNAARLLIRPTEWELAKASLDLIYADVERALAGADPERLKKAISVVEHSHKVFKKHSHDKMRSRSAHALALLNYYAGNLPDAEGMLDEAEQFSGKAGDLKWPVNCSTLMSRIRVKQGRAAEALPLLDKSIEGASDGRLMNQLVVAYIVKGEAHCALGNYSQAVESFGEARKNNERRIVAGFEVSSERNRAWILLSLAEAHLSVNEVGRARRCLEEWRRLGGVELQWLIDKADEVSRRVEAYESQTFTIESDPHGLQWERRKAELASWLINQAQKHAGSEKNKDLADMLGISIRMLGKLKKLGRDDAPPAAKVIFPRRRKSKKSGARRPTL